MPDIPPQTGRTAALVLVLAVASGCGLSIGPFGAGPGPATAGATSDAGAQVVEDPDAVDASDTGPATGATEVLLQQGQALLIAGRHAEAVPPLEAYLVVGENPAHRLAANWSLALVFLLPDSPVRDTRRATPLLERIVDEHPASIEAVHARLLKGLLGDLAQSRNTVDEQRRTIGELNQMVEQLKQIDLNRRPGGGGAGIPPFPR